MVRMKIERIGETKISNEGLKMQIIAYRRSDDIDVLFENGYVVKNRQYESFQIGTIKNPYFRNIFGIGYIGEGKYKTANKDGENYNQYKTWREMIKRCYDGKRQSKLPTYQDCEVCDEWHNYQNFAKWYDENFYTIRNELMSLDKDILKKGNKLYSPEMCVFVPQFINTLFIKCNKSRGNYPIGVSYHKHTKKYFAQSKGFNERRFIGYYNTVEEAFKAYKTTKENYIKRIANKHKNEIPIKLYFAMMNYEVEITD